VTRRSAWFWFVYFLAWIPFAASYTNFFTSHAGLAFSKALSIALLGVCPGALLGVGVVVACERLPWSPKRRLRLLAIHLLLAITYFAGWMAGLRLIRWLQSEFWHGAPTSISAPSFDIGMISTMIVYAAIASVVYAIRATERLQAEQTRVAQLETLRTRAELDALRTQLNPHFLFNTLHSLMALVRHDAKAAEEALEKLATLLRHTLKSSNHSGDVTLREEIEFVRDYLSLEKIRFGERLRIEENIQPEALNCLLPSLSLQPLVENSIKHAIANQPSGGLLRINANRHDGVLILEIADDGPGATSDAVANATGSGLQIARKRLAVRYQQHAKFEIQTLLGRGFAVRMEIPAEQSATTST
jgi:two-component sensor histidine kinase